MSVLPAARKKDLCTGHDCYPPRPNVEGSNNVFTNSREAHRKNDSWASHCCDKSCHGGVTIEGSKTVFINSRPAARVQDKVDCGSVIMTGSHNVNIGG